MADVAQRKVGPFALGLLDGGFGEALQDRAADRDGYCLLRGEEREHSGTRKNPDSGDCAGKDSGPVDFHARFELEGTPLLPDTCHNLRQRIQRLLLLLHYPQ